MAKARQADTSMIVLGSAVAIVVIGILAFWFYFSYGTRHVPAIAYSNFGPIVVRNTEFSVKASFAVQTRNEDAAWLAQHKKELDFALQTALSTADAMRLREPEGVLYVQEMLLEAANTALNTRSIEGVLLTDFIVQSE